MTDLCSHVEVSVPWVWFTDMPTHPVPCAGCTSACTLLMHNSADSLTRKNQEEIRSDFPCNFAVTHCMYSTVARETEHKYFLLKSWKCQTFTYSLFRLWSYSTGGTCLLSFWPGFQFRKKGHSAL